MYRYLQVRRDGAVEHVTLSRPDVRNAFNDEVVAELRQWADGLHQDPGVRVVVLAGAGKVFSAGADAAWMARMADAAEAENEQDALSTTAMLRAINTLPVVVIGRIHGAAHQQYAPAVLNLCDDSHFGIGKIDVAARRTNRAQMAFQGAGFQWRGAVGTVGEGLTNHHGLRPMIIRRRDGLHEIQEMK